MKCLGQIKLDLMHDGIFIPDELLKDAEIARGIFQTNDKKEIVFSLADDFFVHTFITSRTKNSQQLKIQNEGLGLSLGESEIPINIIPPTLFLTNQRKTHSPVTANMNLDGYCLNLFIRKVGKQNNLNMDQSAVLSVIQSAFEEGAAELVQFNMDYCEEMDRGFRRFGPLLKAVKKQFSSFVSFRGFPPDDMRTIDGIYAAGADILVFPLNGFFNEARPEHMMSEAQVLKSLEYAAGVFPNGSVFTEIDFGQGPIDSVTHTIDRLTKRGIIPFIKLPENGIEDQKEYKRIQLVTEHLAETSLQNKLNLKLLYPSSQYVTPLDTGFFSGSMDTAKLTTRPVYKSTLGKKTSEGFAALRRKLRVKNISDSYESAGL
ncbi:MAG: hypothetical protein ACQ9MH_02360 [Nitrospinales bacterium]